MALTSKQQIWENILNSYDEAFYVRVRREQLYVFGQPWDAGAVTSSFSQVSGDIPDFQDITPQLTEIGRSRRIANAEFWALTSVMQNVPKLKCPDVDMITEMVRSQWYAAGYNGTGRYGEWAAEYESAFMDGRGHGIGWVEFGLQENPQTGMQKVCARHSPILQTYWDRTVRNPGKSRFIAFVDYIDYDEAVQMYGKEAARKALRESQQTASNRVVEQVRVIRYYDLGWNGGEPTYAEICGDLSENGATKRQKNPAGYSLPCAYYMHVLVPGMYRPIGQISFQIPTQELINQIERFMRQFLKMPAFQLLDMDRIHPDDLQGLLDGTKQRARKHKVGPQDSAPAAENYDSPRVADFVFSLYQMFDRQYASDSGQTDMDRGNTTSQDKTLGEIQLVDQRSKMQMSWSDLQATKMHIRGAEAAFSLAAPFDRDPITLDVFGQNLLINDPTNPMTWLDQWLQEPSSIQIDVQSLKATDADMEAQAEYGKLQVLGQMGANPQWVLKKALQAYGEQDMSEALAPPPAPPAVDPATGQPVQGQPVAA